jgi:hypothetical protein
MKKLLFILLIPTLIYALGCSSNPEKDAESETPAVEASLNPNGDSELAILMREMYEEGERIKKEIEEGKKPTIKVDYRKMLTAEATEPEKAASDTYHAFTQAYFGIMESLEEATAEEAPKIFIKMVDNCMECHQQLCPGPRMRIKKLYN